MTALPSGSYWGSPTASKRALLIHGLTMASHTWEGIAQALAGAGYLVTAPNLPGHGYRQLTSDGDLRGQALAKDLLSYFSGGTEYDCIIGHSLGAITAVALLPFLPPTKRTSVILLDPPLELSNDILTMIEDISLKAIHNDNLIETLEAENPLWTRQDIIGRAFAAKMCTSEVVQEICKQNDPWSFSSLLETIPGHVFVTILAADPKLSPSCPVESIPAHSQIQAIVVDGVDHWIPYVKPELVVSTALSSVEKLL
ncbi:Alpha/Beta hydrolase protein [Phlebopus sp. FC_14]|nr:Alpha/Beta hydrolase protein [Phlebopus sp. FC_14]